MLSSVKVDIVVPVYNEQEAVCEFHHRLQKVLSSLDCDFHIYYINDGSRDRTQHALEAIAAADSCVTVVELSRNFGHQSALTAGIDLADGSYVITMDGDGEHPASLIPEMLSLASQGYDIVMTQRGEQASLPGFKRWTSSTFYRLINRVGDTTILPGTADFRLLSRRAVLALRSMPEYHRFIRGMVSWIGFRTVILPYTAEERLAGKSKYSLKKMLRLAMDAVFSFSLIPLYFGVAIGGAFLVLALLEAIYVLNFWITGHTQKLAAGWSSLMFVLLVVGGTTMILLGFIGVYIGYIFQEVKRRPVYLIRSTHGERVLPEEQGESEGTNQGLPDEHRSR